VILVFVILFGTGKISGLMGDLAKGIKSFKKEMTEEDASASIFRVTSTISCSGPTGSLPASIRGSR
jgi:sec-independent protein translocase protein TatA